MKYKAGARLKAVRNLFGLTVEEFSELLGLDPIRLKNVEYSRAKVSEEEYQKLGVKYPELMPWIVYEGKLDLTVLGNSENKMVRLVAAKLDAGQTPKEVELEEFITQGE